MFEVCPLYKKKGNSREYAINECEEIEEERKKLKDKINKIWKPLSFLLIGKSWNLKKLIYSLFDSAFSLISLAMTLVADWFL